MRHADCQICQNRIRRSFSDRKDYSGICKFNFRWASNAGGRGVEEMQDVFFCQDYLQDEDDIPME